MVRPISVYHSDFGHCGVTVLGLKVILTKCNIVCIHCKAVLLYEIFKSRTVKFYKALKCGNRFGNIVIRL